MLLSWKANGFTSWELFTVAPQGVILPLSAGPQLPFCVISDTPPQPWPNCFCSSGNLPTTDQLKELVKLTTSFPALPFFVVIKIAPFLATDPYKEEADVPFKTVMDSISFGLISVMPFPKSCNAGPFPPAPPVLILKSLNGTPSITYSGWLFPPPITPNPRRTTLVEPPGVPLTVEISSPATFPCNPSSMLTGDTLLIISELNVCV